MSKKILVVDDEATIRMSLVEALGAEGYEVVAAESGEEALARAHGEAFDLLVTDLRLPGVSGLDILKALRNQGKTTPVIMMTAYGDVDTAVAAMRFGAYDFIPKPFKLGTMKKQVRAALRAARDPESVDEAIERPAAAVAVAAAAAAASDGVSMEMIAACPGLAGVARVLEKIGKSRSGNDTSVLIQGESGSGKEIVARAVHEVSGTRDEPFMEINCAAVPETLLESELFGYEKGAFTDAKARKEGLFELAAQGTIFLDEIGEMGILLQSRLLRVLENRRFRRVGGKDELTVNARIVAATNRRLAEAIEAGAFRNDLYYRLQVVEIDVPPLRERPQDLEVLVNHFLREFEGTLGVEAEPVSAQLLEVLQRYPWPGNVRELKNMLKRIMILEEPRRLEPQHFPPHVREGRNPRGMGMPAGTAGHGLRPLAEVEKQHILYLLEMTDNNKSKAARILGISRQTLREKLRLYEQANSADDGDQDEPLAGRAEG
ncbi:MAG: sigma-54 dependent transcriptional regulator [Candidatus Krumholzibacteriia bacterium]